MTSTAKNNFIVKYTLMAAGPLLFLLIAFSGIIPLKPVILQVMGITIWMILWWITEVVALPITAFLPLALFPVLGIMDLNQTAASYANPIVFLYLAGFFIALAIEKQELHVRISLYLVRWVGLSINKIVLGMMLSTAFLSMWISNTAATLLMLPIAISIIKLVEEEFKARNLHSDFKKVAVSLLLGITYAAVIGGSATIIGTPVNLILVAYLNEMFQFNLTFLGWFVVAFPAMLVMLLLAYFILVKVVFPIKLQNLPQAAELIENKIKELKPMTYSQYAVTAVFILTALGWIFRGILEDLLHISFLNDTTIGLIGGLLMFLLPDRSAKNGFLHDWEITDKLQWGILFLIGGGLALAKSLETSGFIKLIGEWVASAGTNDYFSLLALLVLVLIVLTEFIGNTALATIALPMVFAVATAHGINPILLGVPATFAISFGFMLPMSTAPNAIVFGAGYLTIKDIVKAGFWLDVGGFLLLLALTWAYQFVLNF
jgi:solute carrier family 13 (sodium-dependent dicarboxylate transporter), member 2/3/5